jgi:hypothetical protein
MGQILGGNGVVWSEYIQISVDFKATDVTVNRQKLLKEIKRF